MEETAREKQVGDGRLRKASKRLTGLVNRLIRIVSSVGPGIIVAMMLLTAADVILRYALKRPIAASYEITQFMMVIVVSFGIAYCAVLRGHVKVDLVISRFPKRTQAIINVVTYLLGTAYFALLTRQAIVYIEVTLKSGLTTAVLHLIAYPFVALMALGSVLFCLALIAELFEYIVGALQK